MLKFLQFFASKIWVLSCCSIIKAVVCCGPEVLNFCTDTSKIPRYLRRISYKGKASLSSRNPAFFPAKAVLVQRIRA